MVQDNSIKEKIISNINIEEEEVPDGTILVEDSVTTDEKGWDNRKAFYVAKAGETVKDRYIFKRRLGSGTFGQVFLAFDKTTKKEVALKIIKNHPNYYLQAQKELHFLKVLQQLKSTELNMHVIKYLDSFHYRNHLVIVTELLSINLFELIEKNQYKGLSMEMTRKLCMDILKALSELYKMRIVHCDLKPENVLLRNEIEVGQAFVSLIDFGSACYEGEQSFSYIQSRFYRSPEILLQYNVSLKIRYNTAIDMWSFACMAVELLIGTPLFPGQSQHNLLLRFIETLGMPPQSVIHRLPNHIRQLYFNNQGRNISAKTAIQFARSTQTAVVKMKRYKKYNQIDDMILKTTMGSLPQREAFVDFIKRILCWEPQKRLTPDQALAHPFIATPDLESFNPNWKPPPKSKKKTFLKSTSSPMIVSSPTVVSHTTPKLSHSNLVHPSNHPTYNNVYMQSSPSYQNSSVPSSFQASSFSSFNSFTFQPSFNSNSLSSSIYESPNTMLHSTPTNQFQSNQDPPISHSLPSSWNNHSQFIPSYSASQPSHLNSSSVPSSQFVPSGKQPHNFMKPSENTLFNYSQFSNNPSSTQGRSRKQSSSLSSKPKHSRFVNCDDEIEEEPIKQEHDEPMFRFDEDELMSPSSQIN